VSNSTLSLRHSALSKDSLTSNINLAVIEAHASEPSEQWVFWIEKIALR